MTDEQKKEHYLHLIEDIAFVNILTERMSTLDSNFLYPTYYEDNIADDDIEVSDFFLLYKLGRLKALNVISGEEYNNLYSLYKKKRILEKRLFPEAVKVAKSGNPTNKWFELNSKLYKIDKIFELYNLRLEQIDIRHIVDSCIKNEEYKEENAEKLYEINRKLRVRGVKDESH